MRTLINGPTFRCGEIINMFCGVNRISCCRSNGFRMAYRRFVFKREYVGTSSSYEL